MVPKEYIQLELSTQLLIEGALRRGITVDVLDHADNFIRLRKGDKIEYVKQATKTSADTYISALIMENKEITKIVLREQGLRVPDGIVAYSVADAMEHYSEFAGRSVVIKPKSSNFGISVFVLKQPPTESEFEAAVRQALTYDGTVLIEEFIPGAEYRFLVIGFETVAVLHRMPANVIGDGIHTIEALVTEKNKDPLRGKKYVTPLEKIVLGDVERDYLLAQGKYIDTILSENERVFLRENSNISTGGDSIDFTDTVLDVYKDIAADAARAVNAHICGVDMMISAVDEVPTRENHGIIELNFNPALHIHCYPYQGENRHVEEKVLDLLGF
ncbi:MAG: bifunctional glutamate--cysteine ligase GshA/glutathione synthetase GshB [Actinobacteria bacterium]|nr:bifunctional glutamate--cysteine ligase GshA/glutathione synthetase GshB [Actinomycetota bacterium]